MHTRITQIVLVFLLASLACSGSTSATGWVDGGVASNLHGEYWFHVSKPLTLSLLKGRVILIDVWQFT
jgi:hypothetical protein